MNMIKLQLPNGDWKEFESGITPRKVIEGISVRLLKDTLAAKLGDKVISLDQPITSDGPFKALTFEAEEGKEVFWHSTSHLMAHAVLDLYPDAKFGVGPAIENGFYYDIDLDKKLSIEDFAEIEKKMQEIVKQNNAYIRQELPKTEAIKFFQEKGDIYKVEILSGIDENSELISIYKEGSFTDLCRGPHLDGTGKIKYLKLLSISGCYWKGDEKNKQLQRIYGISFPTKKELDEYLFMLEEAKKRDHRKLGQELDLFFISPKVGVGLPMWTPKGTIIRETLESFMREEQIKRGYQPIVTPHIGNINLYKTSGHYPYYKDSQFPPIKFDDESGEEYILKPMNCPHHFMMYCSRPRSYRDLPIRYSEFGTVYRYEQSGELNGLTRVRCFTQDDSHMFVRPDQLKDEICGVIDLIQVVFTTMGFQNFTTQMSFRDDNAEKYGGELAQWEQAQKDLLQAADQMKLEYVIAAGEAAFYGPKIDFMVRDALGRKWQLGTVQVDYVMPERFDMEYMGSDGQKHRPVVIHRAPFGSLERFIGVMIEHYAGEFPLWLSPLQTVVMPITERQLEYANNIVAKLKSAGIRVELDDRNEKIGYKIRESEVKKIPYMIVVGDKEQQDNEVTFRKHKEGDKGRIKLEDYISLLQEQIKNKLK
jgi:threonyl-tRNA synthetase